MEWTSVVEIAQIELCDLYSPPVQSQDEFLLAFHRRHPGTTSTAFGDARTDDGRSSYDLLVECVGEEAEVVLDLGCGDGHLLEQIARAAPRACLIGVDFSPEELALTRQRSALSEAQLLLGRSQELPLADHSITHVVSHLAFMLMSDIEAVVAEVSRVLAPGGRLSLIVGGGPRVGDAFEVFLEELLPVCATSGARIPAIGDKRTRTESGIASLFRADDGFAEAAIHDFYVQFDGSFEEVWAALCTVYEAFPLGADELLEVKARFESRAAKLADASGIVPCRMLTRRIDIRRLENAFE